jgi:predicted TIM-barrel fold metal-dependent hydrolase
VWTRREFVIASCATVAARPLHAAVARVPFIDSHVHVWKHDPRFPFAPGANVPREDASAEMLLELMHANDVSHTVIIQVIHYKWDDSYLADVLKRYPRQFHGVCRINPEDPAPPDHLSRLTERDGFRGVRLSPAEGPAGDWIRGPLMPALWRRTADLKVPMTLLIPVSRLPDIYPLIEADPDLQVVIDHMADCPVNEPDKLRLLLDLAPKRYPYPDAAAQVRRLLTVFGADRLMAGTDWPISLRQLEYARSVSLYRDHLDFLTPTDRLQILSRTVRSVWPFSQRIR